MKFEADVIVSILEEAGYMLPLPTGRSVSPFNPSITPLGPPQNF